VVAIAVHASALTPSRVFYARDLYSFWHPAVEGFVRSVAEGSWPVWNPDLAFGEPMAANPNFQIAYPPTWLNLLLPATLYFKLFTLGHTVAGALGAACLARRMRTGRLGAFTAGAAWAASGPWLSSLGMFHHFAGAAWMPWVLLALDRAVSRPSARSAVALGGAAAAQALAGSADMCFMTALLAVGWLVARPRAATRAGATPARRVGALAGAAILAVFLAAVQWLPAAALLPGTSRAAPHAESSLYWSLHPLSLLDLVLARLTTGAAATLSMGAEARQRLFESREPLLASVYLGLGAACAAAWALASRRHRRTAVALAIGVAALLAAALGRHTPLLPAFMRLPGVAVFRFPPKYLLPAALAFALLAGLGVDAVARARRQPRGARIFGAALAAAAALLLALSASPVAAALAGALSDPLPAGPLLAHVRAKLAGAGAGLTAVAALFFFMVSGRGRVAPRTAALALAALAAADLVAFGRTVNQAAPADLARYRPPVVDRLRAEGGRRIYSFPHEQDWLMREYVRHPAGWPPSAGWILGALDRLPPAVNARWNISGSYDGDLTGLAPAPLGRLSSRLAELSRTRAGVRLLQAGGVDYVLALDAGVFAGALTPVWEHPSVYRQRVALLRVPDPLPKAFFAPAAIAAPDEAEALRVLEDPVHDLRRTVILPVLAAPPAAAGPPGAAAAAEVRPLWRRSDACAFGVRAGAAGYLVMLEAFAPGWKATLDGRPAPLLAANLLFRAVPVPAGDHEVEMRYRPRSHAAGALATAVGAIAAAVVLFRARRVASMTTGT
jgi:hypothetical protein